MTQMDRVTRIMVNKRYFPNRGTARDVGGMISASSRKKTVSDSRIEMHRVTWKVSSLFLLLKLMIQSGDFSTNLFS